MSFFRQLYFNPLVNKLNKNLKIGQKSYLAFLLVSIMILIFFVYILYSYSTIKEREVELQNLYSISSHTGSLIILLGNKSKNTIHRDEFINHVNALNKRIKNVENEKNKNDLKNILSKIESLSFYSNVLGNIITEQQLDQEKNKINGIVGELLNYKANIEKSITSISDNTDHIFRTRNLLIYIFLLSGILGSVVIANFISYRITDPIEKLKDNISVLENGNYDFNGSFEVLDNDEIGDIARGIDNIGATIRETVKFTEKIGKNEFDTELELNNTGKLGMALLSMRDNLNEVTKQNEIQKLQEKKRNWVIKGLAELGNVLRSNYDDPDEFYFNILRNIINYISANQGGFFIIRDSGKGKILELRSSYAYNRRKYLKKEIEIGEGLIGQCAFEKQITHITDLPDNYIQITSGLGKSNPKNLILAPFVLNDNIYGVMELASFNIFDEFTIDYLNQCAESVASSLASVEINNTTKLLLEKTKIQAEEIASREEEMRQNMEELETTQEESQRKVEQLEQIIAELKNSQSINKD